MIIISREKLNMTRFNPARASAMYVLPVAEALGEIAPLNAGQLQSG
jgi:hypothetical protein